MNFFKITGASRLFKLTNILFIIIIDDVVHYSPSNPSAFADGFPPRASSYHMMRANELAYSCGQSVITATHEPHLAVSPAAPAASQQ